MSKKNMEAEREEFGLQAWLQRELENEKKRKSRFSMKRNISKRDFCDDLETVVPFLDIELEQPRISKKKPVNAVFLKAMH